MNSSDCAKHFKSSVCKPQNRSPLLSTLPLYEVTFVKIKELLTLTNDCGTICSFKLNFISQTERESVKVNFFLPHFWEVLFILCCHASVTPHTLDGNFFLLLIDLLHSTAGNFYGPPYANRNLSKQQWFMQRQYVAIAEGAQRTQQKKVEGKWLLCSNPTFPM